MTSFQLINGDCLEVLKTLPDNSVDSIVTDPPYGLSFMGKKWDYDVPTEEVWKECLRVLKPGGHLLSFAGTRTQHRMAVRIEDAGFEIRDMIAWIYASGFPKSLNIGKAVDKLQGNEREDLGEHPQPASSAGNVMQTGLKATTRITKGNSEWEGWGTALKPALEPITVARKPLIGTVAENVLTHGTGGLNIDESRVGLNGEENPSINRRTSRPPINNVWNDARSPESYAQERPSESLGRWPANLIHDGSEEVLECFPDTGQPCGSVKKTTHKDGMFGIGQPGAIYTAQDGDNRSAARFFYVAKSSKRERNCGLDGYITVKYNECISNNKNLCKEENMVAVQLLQKVISEPTVSFSTGESGESIMVQCHKDSLSTILTESKRITGLKIYNLLTHSLTSESTQDVNLETENGGNLAESVADLKRWILTTTKGNLELALGASRVVLKMLSLISEEENWKPATNFHSTVKPIALMRYLVKLVTPPGGTVLDPFTGSGSTGKACKLEGFDFIGIEREEEYVKIAEARIKAVPDTLL